RGTACLRTARCRGAVRRPRGPAIAPRRAGARGRPRRGGPRTRRRTSRGGRRSRRRRTGRRPARRRAPGRRGRRSPAAPWARAGMGGTCSCLYGVEVRREEGGGGGAEGGGAVTRVRHGGVLPPAREGALGVTHVREHVPHAALHL